MASIDLVILGMIKQEPQSAYDLQKNIEYRNISRWVKISVPSIYKKVVQLEKLGYITGKTVKNGKMPDKVIYSVTELGEGHFLDLMELTAREQVGVFLDFNAVVMYLDCVPQDMQRHLIHTIRGRIEELKEQLMSRMPERGHAPAAGMMIMKQQKNLIEALLEWSDALAEMYGSDKNTKEM